MRAYLSLVVASGKYTYRQPMVLLFGFIFPFVIILAFDFVGSNLMDGMEGSFTQFVIPAILSYSIANAALNASGMTLTAWRVSGLLPRLQTEPLPSLTLVAARFTVTVAVALLQSVILIVFAGAILDFEVSAHWWQALPFVVLGSACFFLLGGILGMFLNSEQAVSSVLNLVLLPLGFLSGCFIPLAMLPDGLVAISQWTPLTAQTQALVATLSGAGGATELLRPAIVVAATAVVAAAVVSAVFRRKNEQ